MTEAPPQPAPTADDLRGPLLDYLRRHTQDPTLSYRDPLQLLADGSTARIFRFRLAGTQGSLARPLVLRILLDSRQAALIAFESAVQSSLASIGYPAPAVLAHHGTGELLGSPFMIMERAPGITLGAVLAGLSLGLPALVLIGALPWPTALGPTPCSTSQGPASATATTGRGMC
ncbi:MAG: hypothetical protein OXU20_18720 [Myxococcales bacterium]|nr:hypothetical protein [Myxococcales bacterium]MDD9971257.1 hypothetical protein [Myxococcales bacterium]